MPTQITGFIPYENYLRLLIDQREATVKRLLEYGEEYHPFTLEHIAEALAETPPLLLAELAPNLHVHRAQKVGELIRAHVYRYWERHAIEAAKKAHPDEYLPRSTR